MISTLHPTRREIKSYEDGISRPGKFFRKDARLVPPVHLQPDVLAYLSDLAETQGTSLKDLGNTLLKEDIVRIDAAKRPGLL